MGSAYPIDFSVAGLPGVMSTADTAGNFQLERVMRLSRFSMGLFSPVFQCLDSLKDVLLNDRLVGSLHIILGVLTVIFHLTGRKGIGGVCFLPEGVADVAFVLYCQAGTNKNLRKLSEVIKKGKNICDYKLYAHTLILQERSNSPIKQRNISS